MQILPLLPSVPRYTFTTILDETELSFRVHWNARDEAWYLDILTADDVPLVCGVKVVLGVPLARRALADVLRGGYLVAIDLSGARQDAGFDDIGTPATNARVQVRWIPAFEATQIMMGLS